MLIYRKSRPATEEDILSLCKSFHALTRELIDKVVAELRRVNPPRGDKSDYTADDDAERDGPRRSLRKPKSRIPGIRRRSATQNTLSVGDWITPQFLIDLTPTAPNPGTHEGADS